MLIHRELAAFFAAIRFFTRLPAPAWGGHAAGLDRAAPYLPLVGALIGGLCAAIYWLAQLVLPSEPFRPAVLLAMGAGLYLTGAFHEDGLADTADGLGGAWDKARILDIMKDSRTGSYGVAALSLALLSKFILLSSLDQVAVPIALLAGHALSRWLALGLMVGMDYARADAAKAAPVAKRLSLLVWLVAGLPVAAVGLYLPGSQLVFALLLPLLSALWLARLFARWLGGYTGDCLGAVQQVTELAFYLGLLVRWPG